jgi:hypothetical protein
MAEKTLTEPDAASLCCRGCRRREVRSDSFAAGVICWARADTPKRKKAVATLVMRGILLGKRSYVSLCLRSGAKGRMSIKQWKGRSC